MSNLIKYTGIVIDVAQFRDNDARVSVLCVDNIKRVFVARGVAKITSKNASICQMLCVATFQVVDKISGMYLLRNGNIIKIYSNIQADLLMTSVANYICEYVYRTKSEKALYQLVLDSLNALEALISPMYILCAFQATINHIQGITPFVDGCVNCMSNLPINDISIIKGGFLCLNCSNMHSKYSKEDLSKFRLLCKLPNQHIYEYSEHIVATYSDFKTLYTFFEEYAGIKMNSKAFIEEIEKLN